MKKVLIAGTVASLALAALPVVGTFAATQVVDTVQVTINQACNITGNGTGTNGGKTVSSTVALNQLVTLGSQTITATCNGAKGYKVKGTFTDLTNGTVSSIKITYQGSAIAAGDGKWTAVKGGSNSTTYLTSGTAGNIISTTAADASTSGVSQEVTYKVATTATQAQGTYTGTATYDLTVNS